MQRGMLKNNINTNKNKNDRKLNVTGYFKHLNTTDVKDFILKLSVPEPLTFRCKIVTCVCCNSPVSQYMHGCFYYHRDKNYLIEFVYLCVIIRTPTLLQNVTQGRGLM